MKIRSSFLILATLACFNFSLFGHSSDAPIVGRSRYVPGLAVRSVLRTSFVTHFTALMRPDEMHPASSRMCLLTILATSPRVTKNILQYRFSDTTKFAEIDKYWAEASRTVREGDFEGYKATYHEDAVVVFATGKTKRSVPVSGALDGWKQGFIDTKTGKRVDNVEFRFSQRIVDETTAHETGIFNFTSKNVATGAVQGGKIHFEGLLVKKNGKWLMVMEYQKEAASDEEWDRLVLTKSIIE